MVVEWLTTHLFDGLGSDESRFLATGVTLLLGIVIYLVAPFLVRRLVRMQRYRLVDKYAGSSLSVLEETINWPFPTKAVVRIVQMSIVVCIGLVLLVIWQFDTQVEFVVEVLLTSYPLIIRFFISILFILAGYIGTRLLRSWLHQYTAEVDHISQHQESVAFRVLQVSVFMGIGVAVISLWGVDITGLLVGAGFLGIVVGMAARQTLGSLIAGFVLMFSRPFKIGHWVEIGDHEGIVTDISMVNTRLRSFNDEAIVIPNDMVANQSVVNFSESERLRLSLDVGIEYDTDIDRAQEAALAAIENIDQILRNPPPSVVPTTFNDSSIGLRLRYWIEYPSKPKEWNAHAAVVREVKQTFDEEGITIPFPQRTLRGRVATPSPEEGS